MAAAHGDLGYFVCSRTKACLAQILKLSVGIEAPAEQIFQLLRGAARRQADHAAIDVFIPRAGMEYEEPPGPAARAWHLN